MSAVVYWSRWFAKGILVISTCFAIRLGEAQEPAPVFALPPLEEFNAVVERPLFTPDRRPPQNAPAAEAPAANVDQGGSEQQVVLVGTAMDQGNRTVAILNDVSQGIQFRVRVGDQVGGWTIKAIKPRTIVLTTMAQEVTVTLEEPTLPPATAEK